MRALILYASGYITIESLDDAKVRKGTVKYPGTTIQAFTAHYKKKGRVWTSSFSKVGWSDSTLKMAKLCRTHVTDDAMDNIIRQAKSYSKASRHQAKETAYDSDFDPDDSILNLPGGLVISSDG